MEEQELRARVVAVTDAVREAGLSVGWLASELGLALRTIWSWLEKAAGGLLAALRRGRPRDESDREMRRAVLELLWAYPHLGPRRIAAEVPGLSRRTVSDWKERVRRRKVRAAELRGWSCWWRVPGSVWAMDHTDLPVAVDGGGRGVLVVRDLASGYVLSTAAALEGTGGEVAAELKRLFVTYGAPLAIKCDNGSPLIARPVVQLLKECGVVLLRSPPRRPSYNGAAERGLGWWKVLVAGCVAESASEARCSAAELQRGRLLANALHRGRRRSADEEWAARGALSTERRQQFLAAYAAARAAEWAAVEVAPEEVRPGSRLDATIGRRAARVALCQLDYLTIRRRRDPAGDARP